MLPGAIGSFANAPAAAAGYTATKSIDFDGTDDYVSLGSGIIEGDWTDGFARAVSLWVKTTDARYGYWLISHADIDAGDYEFGMLLQFGQLCVWCGGGISYGPTINDGAWHHVVASVYEVSGTPTLHVWLDGALEYTSTAIYAVAAVSTWLVGAVVDGAGTAGHLAARITNVSLWTGSDFDASAVSELYNSGAPGDVLSHSLVGALAGWWKFGDGDTYPTLQDLGPLNKDGTMTNMASGDIVTDAP